MVWFIFAIFGALFQATYYTLVKKYLKGIDQYVLASGVFLSSFAILFLISLILGIPEIGPYFYIAVLTTGTLNIFAVTLYLKSFKITDLSLSVPMISFTPIFLILTSFILLREFPTVFGISGIFLIVIGSYILNTTRDGRDLLKPFKEMFRNRGVLYMLIVGFLFSISSNFDKMVVINSDPIFGYSVVHLFLGLVFLIISSYKKTHDIRGTYRKNYNKFLLAGLALALVAITINTAFTMQIVPYVISLKRSSILFSIFFGGLIFKEKNIFKRGLGAFVMLIGMILIILL
ncbi:MAG: EamA family transporter [Candidatus Aenigmatarchaeota archaeon]|nr:MAG: EamA family transporter [Candidatus Aenigmarchaeota archaeon]